MKDHIPFTEVYPEPIQSSRDFPEPAPIPLINAWDSNSPAIKNDAIVSAKSDLPSLARAEPDTAELDDALSQMLDLFPEHDLDFLLHMLRRHKGDVNAAIESILTSAPSDSLPSSTRDEVQMKKSLLESIDFWAAQYMNNYDPDGLHLTKQSNPLQPPNTQHTL